MPGFLSAFSETFGRVGWEVVKRPWVRWGFGLGAGFGIATNVLFNNDYRLGSNLGRGLAYGALGVGLAGFSRPRFQQALTAGLGHRLGNNLTWQRAVWDASRLWSEARFGRASYGDTISQVYRTLLGAWRTRPGG